MANEEYTPYEKSHRLRKLLLVVAVVSKGQGNFINDLLIDQESYFTITTGGRGTAPSEIYAVLGESDLKKDVLFGVVREDQWPAMREKLNQRFSVSKIAKGIAYAIPLDAVASVSAYKMLTNTQIFEKPINPNSEKKGRTH